MVAYIKQYHPLISDDSVFDIRQVPHFLTKETAWDTVCSYKGDLSKWMPWPYLISGRLLWTFKATSNNKTLFFTWCQHCHHWWHQRFCYDNLWRHQKLASWQLLVFSVRHMWSSSLLFFYSINGDAHKKVYYNYDGNNGNGWVISSDT